MKVATIEAQFPSIKGSPIITGKGRGIRPKTAIQNAIRDVLADERVYRKHWSVFKATVTVENVNGGGDGGE